MISHAAVAWRPAYRLIRSLYPPVWLFEDIADPADWDLIASAEAKTNPRVRDQIGDLSLVPPDRRVAGPTASLVMGAFTHASRDRPSRFSDGSFGAWYCGDRFEVGLAETAYHFERFMRATAERAAEAQYREVLAAVTASAWDLRGGGHAACLDPDDWTAGQALGAAARAADADAIVYPSVRHKDGEACAVLRPDRVSLPVRQGRHLLYHWDGARMDRWFDYGRQRWYLWPLDGPSERPQGVGRHVTT